MDTRHLKAFLAVCDAGNITRSSETLHLSQPALTRRMQELESYYDVQLFERGRKGVLLTEAGYHLQVRAREIVALESRTKEELEARGGRVKGVVRIGCVETNAAHVLAHRLARWHAENPEAQFELYAADGDDLRARLDEGGLDMAVLIEPVEVAKYESIPADVTERWGIVLRRDAPEVVEAFERRGGAVTVEELARMPLILPRRHIVREALRAWFGEAAENLRIAGWHNLPTNTLELVRAGLGGIVCVEGAFDLRPAPDLVFLPLTPERRSKQCWVRLKNRKLSRAAESFWAFGEEGEENEGRDDADAD